VPFDNSPALNGVRVLIVDDEVDSREFLVAALEQCEAKVFAFASASEALVAVSRLKPDVLVSDIAMPLEDGYSFNSQKSGNFRQNRGDRFQRSP
jgi:CheY-like chemotaxis protein